MRRLCFLTLLFCLTSHASAKELFIDSVVTHIEFPDWFIENPFNNLQEELDNALAKGKKGIMVLYITEGCSYCHVFIQRSLGDPVIAAAVQKDFDSIGFEIFDDVEMVDPKGNSISIKQFALKEGVEYSPTVLFYGKDGARLLRLVGYQSPERFTLSLEYVVNDYYNSMRLGDFIKERLSKDSTIVAKDRLTPDPLFEEPPHNLDRRSGPGKYPILVILEKKNCVACEEFHYEVLNLDDIRETMEWFDIVQLDADDTHSKIIMPDGKAITPAALYEASGFTRVPSLLFFNTKGEEVLKTDTLILRQRLMNSMDYVLEHAYLKDWTYQQFARSKAIERYRYSTKE